MRLWPLTNPSRSRSRAVARVALALTGLLVLPVALPADAKPKSRQIETEAKFGSFDAEASTITVKVIKAGKSVKGLKKLRKGKDATFRVVAEGSVLTRTTVKLLSGRAATFQDLEEGQKIKIFWIPDEKNEGGRFARSISMFRSTEEVGEDVD